jgi:hypothetical protein
MRVTTLPADMTASSLRALTKNGGSQPVYFRLETGEQLIPVACHEHQAAEEGKAGNMVPTAPPTLTIVLRSAHVGGMPLNIADPAAVSGFLKDLGEAGKTLRIREGSDH